MSYIDFILNAGALLGYIIIFLIIFAESGLLIGFIFPGDSLLVSLGIIASQGHLNIWVLVVLMTIAAIMGDSAGYATGRKFGPGLFNKPDSRFFKKEYLEKAQAFYDVHGKKTIVLARFTPFVRTFAPIVAGIAKMPYKTFLFYNIIGGFLWVWSITLLGYFLGSQFKEVEKYILVIIGAIIMVSVLPTISHLLKNRAKS